MEIRELDELPISRKQLKQWIPSLSVIREWNIVSFCWNKIYVYHHFHQPISIFVLRLVKQVQDSVLFSSRVLSWHWFHLISFPISDMITKPILKETVEGLQFLKPRFFEDMESLWKRHWPKKCQTKTHLAILIKSKSPS